MVIYDRAFPGVDEKVAEKCVDDSNVSITNEYIYFFFQNGQLQQRLDNVQRDFIIFNREK